MPKFNPTENAAGDPLGRAADRNTAAPRYLGGAHSQPWRHDPVRRTSGSHAGRAAPR